jgi:multicomponent Na+:H+ antiporter subunit G
MITEIFTALFLLMGSIFIFISCLGVLNMPDTLCRSHALSKAMTLGISLMLIALWIHFDSNLVGLKVFLAITLQFITIPLSGHLFALYISKKLIKYK